MKINEIQVLVVDDSQIMRRIVEKKLVKMGVQKILGAANGRSAFDIITKNKIDLIISDWSMPGMTGIDLLNALRQEEKFDKIPFIFVSAEAQLFNILMAYRLRVDEYITKPFTNKYFEYAIGNVLSYYYNF